MSQPICSICSTPFEPHFRYQREVSTYTDETGAVSERAVYFCSQRCLEQSHHQRESGLVGCAACAREFQVTLALQIVFTGGKVSQPPSRKAARTAMFVATWRLFERSVG